MKKFNVSVFGASGYTGAELLRLLSEHPHVDVKHITASTQAGKNITEVYPHLKKRFDLILDKTEASALPDDIDVVFTALPHGASASLIKNLYDKDLKIIDLGADFRLNENNYNNWYGDHPSPELIDSAVYGIPELYKKEISVSKLIANPGCYPTSSILPLAPLIKNNLIDEESIIIDSKSGASGAGRTPSAELHFGEVNEGFKAYKVGGHRHTPEIEQQLSDYTDKKIRVVFTPHLLPVDRGILSTIYVNLRNKMDTEDLIKQVEDFYRDSYFVRLCTPGNFPNISHVRGSNFCDIGIFADRERKTAIIVSVIDNLVKGASGQAIQNMNIMLDLPETTGIGNLPLYP